MLLISTYFILAIISRRWSEPWMAFSTFGKTPVEGMERYLPRHGINQVYLLKNCDINNITKRQRIYTKLNILLNNAYLCPTNRYCQYFRKAGQWLITHYLWKHWIVYTRFQDVWIKYNTKMWLWLMYLLLTTSHRPGNRRTLDNSYSYLRV